LSNPNQLIQRFLTLREIHEFEINLADTITSAGKNAIFCDSDWGMLASGAKQSMMSRRRRDGVESYF
jgi:hypothetical protein